MASVKVRRFTLLAADKDGGNKLTITLDASNLGFNPVGGFRKAQIACNEYDAAGTFTVDFRPAGADSTFFLPFTSQEGQQANAGADTVIIGRKDIDPIFDALKLEFSGVAAADVELYVGFINEDE
jgi:hypothetical protein